MHHMLKLINTIKNCQKSNKKPKTSTI